MQTPGQQSPAEHELAAPQTPLAPGWSRDPLWACAGRLERWPGHGLQSLCVSFPSCPLECECVSRRLRGDNAQTGPRQQLDFLACVSKAPGLCASLEQGEGGLCQDLGTHMSGDAACRMEPEDPAPSVPPEDPPGLYVKKRVERASGYSLG